MKSFAPLPLLFTGIFLFAGPARTTAALPFFGKDEMKEVPASEELQRQEQESQALFQKALAEKEAGKLDKAEDILEDAIERFPLAPSAATAQFELGRVLEAAEKPLKAFDAYQKFIETYRDSDLYGEAVKRQFELATFAMNGKTGSVLGLIPTKSNTTRVVEMFEKIAANAPRSTYAPQALFNIGMLQKDADKEAEAIAAFQKLQDNYPSDPKTKEATVEIIAIREGRTTNDDSQILKNQLEMEKFITDFSNDPRSGEMQAKVAGIESQDAEKKLHLARYYERKGNLRAAAIYYQDIKEGTGAYESAQKRLAELKAQDPNLVAAPSAPRSRVVAQENVVDRPDYNGPPSPKLESPAQPKMRASAEDVIPIPGQ